MISRTRLSTVPLLPVTACFCGGIILQLAGYPLWTLAILLAVAGILAFFNTSFSALAGAASLGLLCAFLSRPPEDYESLANRELTFGAVVENVKELESSQRLIVTLDNISDSVIPSTDIRPVKACLIITGAAPYILPGQGINFTGKLQCISIMTDLPDEIDPSSYLLHDDVMLQGFISGQKIIAREKNFGLRAACKLQASRMREKVIIAINESSLTPFAKDFLVAAIAGDSSYITSENRTNFAKAGLSHILAISGLHVGLIAMIVTIALWPMHALGFNGTRSLCVILLLWGFAFMTGLTDSVVRASVMATVYLAGRMSQQRTNPLNTLCLSALVILILSPQSLFLPGFQLSFASVASIIVFADKLNPVSPRRRLPYMAMSYLTVSFSAILGTGLISAIYFHSFPVYFLFANLIASALLPLIIGGGIIVVILFFLSFPSGWICAPVSWCSSLLQIVTDGISSLPGASIGNIYIESWTVVPLFALLIWLKTALDRGRKQELALVSCGFFIYILLICAIPGTTTDPRMYITRDKQHTELLYPNTDGSLHIIPTNPLEPGFVKQRAEFRYRDYMGKRGINRITIDTTAPRSDKLITYGGRTIGLFSGKPEKPAPCKLDYAIICRGERDDMHSFIDEYRPDSIILAYDLNPRRAKRYIGECQLRGVPCLWLRESAWSLSGRSD